MNIPGFLPERVLEALGWSLVHSLWQGAVVSLLLALVLWTTHRHSAKSRYTISVAALAMMFLLWAGTLAMLLSGEAVSPVATTVGVLGASPGAVSGQVAPLFFLGYFEQHLPLMVTLWMMGLLVLSLRLIGGIAWAQRLRSYRVRPVPRWLEHNVAWMCRVMKIKVRVVILESAMVHTPMVIGHLKPVILLPIGAVTRIPREQLESLLLHELGHILRNDYLVNMLQSIVETLLFYHPAVWWISGRIRIEREHCCDDIAVNATGDPLTFAKALANIKEVPMNVPQMALAATGRKGPLMTRIRRAMEPTPNPSGAAERLVALFALMLCMSLLTINAAPAMPYAAGQDDEYGMSESTWSVKRNGKKVVIENDNGEIRRLTVNGEEIPPENWSEYLDYIDEARDAESRIQAEEALIRAEEETLRGHEEALRAQEADLRRQEELMVVQEQEMKEQEALMRAREEQFRLDEERMQAEEIAMRQDEERFRAEEAIMRAEEERMRAEEVIMRREEERMRAEEVFMRREEERMRKQELEMREHERQVREEERQIRQEEREARRAVQERTREVRNQMRDQARQLSEERRALEASLIEEGHSYEEARQKAAETIEKAASEMEVEHKEMMRSLEKEREARSYVSSEHRDATRAKEAKAAKEARQKAREMRDLERAERAKARDEARQRGQERKEARIKRIKKLKEKEAKEKRERQESQENEENENR